MLLAILERMEALPSFFFPSNRKCETYDRVLCHGLLALVRKPGFYSATNTRYFSFSLSLFAYFKGLTNTVAAFWPWYRSPSHNAARWRYRARKKNSYFTAIYKKLDFQIRSQEHPRPRAWEQHCGEERGKKRKEENWSII